MRAIKDVINTVVVLALVVGTFLFLGEIISPSTELDPRIEAKYEMMVLRFRRMPQWGPTDPLTFEEEIEIGIPAPAPGPKPKHEGSFDATKNPWYNQDVRRKQRWAGRES